MKIFLAFFLSFLLHLTIFFYLTKNEITKTEQTQKQRRSTQVKFVHLVQPQEQTTKQIVQKQKQIKQSQEITQDKVPSKNISNLPLVKIPDVPKTEQIQRKIEEQKQSKQEVKKEEQVDNVTKSYLELYKDDFDELNNETKVYLLKNLKDIGRITERFLIYPYIGIRARQQGVNVVEFTLYPDGKISKPKIIKSSRYYILDDNTEETIIQAYRDYPRPEKPAIIRIYVKYTIN